MDDRERFIEMMTGPTEAGKAEVWRGMARRFAAESDLYRKALEDIALLDEADGHELKQQHAFQAVAIATRTLNKHPSEIYAERRKAQISGLGNGDA